MGITLDLPDELEAALSDEADRLNLPLSEYILPLLMTGRPRHTMPVTGAELVAYWQREGLIGTRPDGADSPEYARELRRRAERRLMEYGAWTCLIPMCSSTSSEAMRRLSRGPLHSQSYQPLADWS